MRAKGGFRLVAITFGVFVAGVVVVSSYRLGRFTGTSDSKVENNQAYFPTPSKLGCLAKSSEMHELLNGLSNQFRQLSKLSYSCLNLATVEGLVVPSGSGNSAIERLSSSLRAAGWSVSRQETITVEASKGAVSLVAIDLPTLYGRFDGQGQVELRNGFAEHSLDGFAETAVSLVVAQEME
jgi:hypothetical protein